MPRDPASIGDVPSMSNAVHSGRAPLLAVGLFPRLMHFFVQRVLQDVGEVAASEGITLGEDYSRVAVDEVGVGNGVDAIQLGDAGLPTASVVDLRPGHAHLVGHALELVGRVRLVERNAKNVDTPAMELAVSAH